MNRTYEPFDGNAAMAMMASFLAAAVMVMWYFPLF